MRYMRGITLIELMIAIIVSSIILSAMVALYISSDRIFRNLKPASDVVEEMRGALTTLDFIFSRWGVAVPCAGNNCSTSSPPPDCDTYPPSDPMCITVIGNSEAIFYANLYGMGFVVSVDGSGTAQIISCRLRGEPSHNCHYVWKGDKLLSVDGDGNPVDMRVSNLSESNIDCLGEPTSPNATVSSTLTDNQGLGISVELQPGYVISRVPHRIRLYVSGDWLMMEQTDMSTACVADEPSVRIAKVSNFSIRKEGRGVLIEATFVSQSQPEKRLSIVRYFGR